MQNPTTMKPAMPAPIISEGVDRGPDIPRFQRPTLDAKSKRPTPDDENREVKKSNTERRTPSAEHRTPNGTFESNKGKRPTSNAQHPTPNEENHEVILSFSLPSGRWRRKFEPALRFLRG
jgi:hypothetical protein